MIDPQEFGVLHQAIQQLSQMTPESIVSGILGLLVLIQWWRSGRKIKSLRVELEDVRQDYAELDRKHDDAKDFRDAYKARLDAIDEAEKKRTESNRERLQKIREERERNEKKQQLQQLQKNWQLTFTPSFTLGKMFLELSAFNTHTSEVKKFKLELNPSPDQNDVQEVKDQLREQLLQYEQLTKWVEQEKSQMI